jgi:hypothetical protein
MATRNEEFFHDKWLGHVQTESDGLVVAKPVLLEAGCARTLPPEIQNKLRELCPKEFEDTPRRISNLPQFFEEMLDLDGSLFDTAEDIPEDVSLYAPEGPQTLRPTLGLLHQNEPTPIEGAGSPASNAASKYIALVWDVTDTDEELNSDALGLLLDKSETITGEWSYPAAAKFDRLLRHCRVPVGIITNREVIRLVYAPHGESSGYITFRIEDMTTVGGRPILDAMVMLLNANQWFGVSDENALPSLLSRSREHQGSVTDDLAEQVFSGLETLLQGFQTAAERDKSTLLLQALEQDEDHLYRGLLTVMLRLVFILYAEDRSLLPVEHPLYAKRMSLLGLFERLQRDHGNFPDSMNNRFGAWGHIISLSRAIYLGVDHGDFHIPPRQGDLFDPHRFKFLEGWTGESAPVITHKARSEVEVPTVDDGTVFSLLRSLLIFQGQRLSYRTLDVEQIGSVYEALMGYHVIPCESAAVAIKISNKKGSPKYWLETDTLLSIAAAQRLKWLQSECGFDKATATKIKKTVDSYNKTSANEQGTLTDALLTLTTGKKNKTQRRLANIGQYVLQPGAERRRSGSHYTPRSLTSPIVQKTLQPLLRCLGDAPTADQILELKLCDPAMGSGAFLVECCRQLADEVVAAWGRDKQVEEISILCPEGDVVAHARRLVAQRCLYGVDKNIMAVQLAKLSLWLFTLARELPFTFLDHSLRYGDSLVGLNFEQIKAFNWQPKKQISFLEDEIKKALDEVVSIRQEIHSLAGDATPEGQKLKAQRLFDANDATEKVRKIADVCVGAFFAKDKNKPRLEERQFREGIVRAWLSGDEEAGSNVDCWVKEIRDFHAPFHWWIEFPEVFYEERPDPLTINNVNGSAYMDGIIGNPPFLGGVQISGAYGGNMLSWLLELDPGSIGKADLCTHFLHRGRVLLGDIGSFGLILTSSVARGDSRQSGLRRLLLDGARIYSATTPKDWPGVAAVQYVEVIGDIGAISQKPFEIDGIEVIAIDSQLEAKVERLEPSSFKENKRLRSKGMDLSGDGFILGSDEYNILKQKNIKNLEVISPYLGTSELVSDPEQKPARFVIDFRERSLLEASNWPDVLNIVKERVQPPRNALKPTPVNISLQKNWWRYWAERNDFFSKLKKYSSVIATGQTMKHISFSFVDPNIVFTQKVFIFALHEYSSFSVLQSRVHDSWARHRCSLRGETLSYSITACFDSFCFPNQDENTCKKMTSQGQSLLELRTKIMEDKKLGITDIYNSLLDSECTTENIIALRRLHETVDRTVLDAYGWTDIEVPPYCPITSEDEAAIKAFSDEVIDRLYALNVERAVEEERLVLTKKRTAKKVATKSLPTPNPTLDLF